MRRAASAAPPPGPMGPLPPRPTATPAGRPRSAAQRAPGSAPRHYRGASPAGVPLPAPGTPPGVPAPRLSASTSAQDRIPAPRLSASTSLCSGSPPRGSVRIPLLEVSAPRLLPGVPAPRFSASSCSGLCPADPLWVPASRPLACAPAPRLSALLSCQAPRLSAHPARGTLLLGSLHAPAVPGACRPGWRLRSPRARPGSQRGGAAPPPGLPARSSPPGPARPPPPPCEHAPPPGTPRPGTAAGRGRDGTGRDGTERKGKVQQGQPPSPLLPSLRDRMTLASLGAVAGSVRGTRAERGPAAGSGEMTPSIPGARGAVQDGHGHSSAGLSSAANGAERCGVGSGAGWVSSTGMGNRVRLRTYSSGFCWMAEMY
ncbi:uncharacterized protein LOC113459120 [Zonotrichia albicollis]|uniref:uncharacterized protein LOC113459120 n=1 Tax=Zonotrichia albicollis TaxID=44394 RepID=UPI003D80FA39